MKKFFKRLTELYDGVEINGEVYAVKYYCQATSFSYEIHKGCIYKDENSDYTNYLFNFLDTPLYESKIYHFWDIKTKKILEDIENQLKTYENIKSKPN